MRIPLQVVYKKSSLREARKGVGQAGEGRGKAKQSVNFRQHPSLNLTLRGSLEHKLVLRLRRQKR